MAINTNHLRPPHFLLFAEARKRGAVGEWRFVLQAADGSECVEAEDREPLARSNRLELLALVRGLEALDQPSRVSLLTRSQYIERGLSLGLEDWRKNGWSWEYFGQLKPVKNRDLWQRVDRALGFHSLELSGRRFDPPHSGNASGPKPRGSLPVSANSIAPVASSGLARHSLARQWKLARLRLQRGMRDKVEAAKLAYAQLGGPLSPAPWLG